MVILIDDMVDTGGTMAKGAQGLKGRAGTDQWLWLWYSPCLAGVPPGKLDSR